MQWIVGLAEDVTTTYRYQSMLSAHTDFPGNIDVYTSFLGAISASLAGCNCNTSFGIINNQTYRILINVYSQHKGIIYVIESDYK